VDEVTRFIEQRMDLPLAVSWAIASLLTNRAPLDASESQSVPGIHKGF
jgi:hypothetical protein